MTDFGFDIFQNLRFWSKISHFEKNKANFKIWISFYTYRKWPISDWNNYFYSKICVKRMKWPIRIIFELKWPIVWIDFSQKSLFWSANCHFRNQNDLLYFENDHFWAKIIILKMENDQFWIKMFNFSKKTLGNISFLKIWVTHMSQKACQMRDIDW